MIGTTSGTWTILDVNGATALTFDSFIDLEYFDEGMAPSYPVEEGSFANYNKTQNPLDIRITLGRQGTDSDFEYFETQLREYQDKPILLAVATPSGLYENLTLESYRWKRALENNAGMMVVELIFSEVRQQTTQVRTTSITKPKNPTSSDKVNTGKTQRRSVLKTIEDKITS